MEMSYIRIDTLITPALHYNIFFRPNETQIIATKHPSVHVKIGDVVSFAESFSTKTKEKHIHRITRVRSDLNWEEVMYNYFRK